MTVLSDISKAANTRMVLAQIDHAKRTGANQTPAFNFDIDSIVKLHKTKMDNLHALDGTSVADAKAALDVLATAVKAAGPVVPAAA
ncbi:hypothetical protein AB7828_03830 [Tardiphaga sp. 215_C5_N2_1]|uniref:hypothetical protein n=1 Tax=Tardiphaga sp. 215_C5_N2_1 TaxID=3240774 RepID=UPI003F8A0A69